MRVLPSRNCIDVKMTSIAFGAQRNDVIMTSSKQFKVLTRSMPRFPLYPMSFLARNLTAPSPLSGTLAPLREVVAYAQKQSILIGRVFNYQDSEEIL